MSKSQIIPACYKETGARRFDGNPFIEALPEFEESGVELMLKLSNYPPIPSDKTRCANIMVRNMELMDINDIVTPFPSFEKLSVSLTTIMRESYVARNPLYVTDVQRRYALMTNGAAGLAYPSDWKTSAKGHTMISVSGMGKTTFATSFLLRYPQVIEHSQYHGTPLKVRQVVYLFLRIPHDATIRSLCMQFFQHIDELLGTNYVSQAKGRMQIAAMVELMHRVATTVSLGFLVIDEVQNLRSARSGQAELAMNLFSEIIERLGISLLLLATPALQPVIERSVRNARKMASWGTSVLSPMDKKSEQWTDFCALYWEYMFVKKKGLLTKEVMDAWHHASAGNTAFAVLAFMKAQQDEIGEREFIDASSFKRVETTHMAFLQPAIAALRSRKPDRLRRFEDLLPGPEYGSIRKLLGATDEISPLDGNDNTEFDDVHETKSKRVKQPASKARSFSEDFELPMEDPLTR